VPDVLSLSLRKGCPANQRNKRDPHLAFVCYFYYLFAPAVELLISDVYLQQVLELIVVFLIILAFF
jgi:hypothetical protein